MIETLIAFTLLINAERAVPLTPDLILTLRAEERAEFLCETGQWSHEGWLGSFKGLPVWYVGENLAKDFVTRESAHEALMASPSHKANIVNENYRKLGVAKGDCGVIVELFTD